MIEQRLLNVNNCEQWLLTTVVDRVQHNIVEQCAAQHCNKLSTTLIKLYIFAQFQNITYSNRPDRVAQLVEHWASIPKVVGSIPIVVRHIFKLAWCRYRLKAGFHSGK